MEEQQSIGSLVWLFVNSPVGLTIVGSVLVWILGMVFRQKPTWQKIYDEHKGLLVDAVKHAERAIPDDTENKAAARADAALKFVLKVQSHLGGRQKAVKEAINAAHNVVERKER